MGSLNKPPKIGKTGAQKIKDLLAEESESLAANTERLAKALQVKRDKPNDPAPESAYKAIRGIRGYYAGLRSDISVVKTGSNDAKQDVLDGLKGIDRGYAGFAAALRDRNTGEGAKAMQRATRIAAAGTKQLKAGRHDL